MQTADRLIDKLQIAIRNVDDRGMIEIDGGDAREIGAYLRYMVGKDAPGVLAHRMGLTQKEEGIYRALVTSDQPISAADLVPLSGCKTVESVWTNKCRLRAKLEQHKAGRIDTVRGEGYRLVGCEG